MKNLLIIFFLLLISLYSCSNFKGKEINKLVNKWSGREVVFPDNMVFTRLCKDTVVKFWPFHENYSIIVYVDSVGCLSCRLQLGEWKSVMAEYDSILGEHIPVLFYFASNDVHEISHILKKDNFNYPICIDGKDSLYKLNHFPSDMMFQTFLLDKNNKVVAIGNPVHNPKIKELYLNIIQGKKDVEGEKTLRTEITIKEPIISLGHFNWKEEKKTAFKIENTGKYPLIINDVTTSCGCTSVDYSKEPVRPGDSISLQVTYKADHPEHFDKTITVYCNANPSLVHLKIMGDAE